MRLSQAIEEYSAWRGFKVTGETVVRYHSALRIFCLVLGDPDAGSINFNQVMHYLQEMDRLGWKRNGILISILAVRSLFTFLELRGEKVMSADLIPLPRKKINLPRVANERDFNKLLNAIPKDEKYSNLRNRALVSMVWDTWARTGEIISLNIEDLTFAKDGSGSAIIKTEKSRGRRPIREIFWTKKTSLLIKRWLKARDKLAVYFDIERDNPVFISIWKAGGYDSRGKRMTNRGVCEVFRTNSNRAGLESTLNAHSVRHFGGRHIISSGGANSDVTNILGHSHLSSSEIYTMIWGQDLKKRYDHFKSFR